MNAAARKAYAAKLAAIVVEHGGTVIVDSRKGYDYVAVTLPGIRFSTDLEMRQSFPGILGHFYYADKPLADDFADSINPVHRTKATLYRNTHDGFLVAFAQCCKRIKDGSAFQ